MTARPSSTVKAAEADVTKVMEILESHAPIDIDERATRYGHGSRARRCAAGGRSSHGGHIYQSDGRRTRMTA